MICKKDEVLNAARFWESCNSPLASVPGQNHAAGLGKLNFDSSKGHRLAYYLFICGIFVQIGAHEIITVVDFFGFLKNACS